MSFADKYLKKQQVFPDYITSGVPDDLGLVVTIPCFDEPDLVSSLKALWLCDRPSFKVEVIVIVNSGEQVSDEVLSQNAKTIADAKEWMSLHEDEKLKFFLIDQPNLPQKAAGVGLARKIAMDEAVSRFNKIGKSNGIITGYDADSSCDINYFTEIEKLFKKYPKANGANIFYEHPLEGDEFSEIIYNSIAQYELYLRYYMLAMRFAGHPHAYHTVGSSFAVSAEAYIKQGGMNRRQAGEDFYFLQKIIALGNFYEIKHTRVIPSPRTSDRVPFGTGKAMSTFVNEGISNYKNYNYAAFRDLKVLFDRVDDFFGVDHDTFINKLIVELPGPVRSYLKEDNFFEALDQINRNCASIDAFRKKFFGAFNAFKVLKYLNNVHEQFMEEESVIVSAKLLLKDLGITTKGIYSAKELLEIYREYERTH
ncbi:glycosyltransferase family 2 protein [Ancylomarina euxinus]|uniref:Glycosyltransferase family 2 protein n=1 Tax=Ancylomarina euxinus TaxID=2283627 RepID=A0A425XXY9_9BACT|nr:glycosyltransferase family 2 protein [Ancylomarina euxinus]MCZ4695872.1 glycosyltransferase family 2 protein [Ancylomarina euxinus]MUP16247.1 glycosyltransferase family 2 protein [Ancylomarina euxinus]RRG19618.1 glycosyltransferase family 2 protein [Ancylomarina euxinus]